MREWVCRLQLILSQANVAILKSESRGTQIHILLSQIRDCPKPSGPSSHIYIAQKEGGPIITPATGFPLPHKDYGGDTRTRLHTGNSEHPEECEQSYGLKPEHLKVYISFQHYSANSCNATTYLGFNISSLIPYFIHVAAD
jgi:hypothetical protein